MSLSLLLGVAVALIIVVGWTFPAAPRRKFAMIVCRIALLLSLGYGLRGCSVTRWTERPRHIVYFLDRSDSVSAQQREQAIRRVASLEAIRPKAVTRSVWAFGADAQPAIESGAPALTEPERLASQLDPITIDSRRTNFEAALLQAAGALEQPDGSRIVLLTDGRQTAGSVERVLPHLRRMGIALYPTPIAPAVAADKRGVSWDGLAAPDTVQEGSSIPVTIALTNSSQTVEPVEVTISMQGLPVERIARRLAPGSHVLTLSVPAVKAGTSALDVAVRTAASVAPERRQAYVEVEGSPRVLLVREQPGPLPPVAAALRDRKVSLAVTTIRELPVEAGRLLDYDAVLLEQAPKSAFEERQVAALERYVRQFGGGLVMIGLGGKLDREIAQDAPLDRLLPVRFDPKGAREAQRRVCIIMLIDRSASMMGPRIAATKRAAIELIKQLATEDLVGIYAFDTEAYVVVELQQARNVTDTLVDRLVHLKSSGGTDIFPALKTALGRFLLSDATVRHLLLLSDGMTPMDVPAYRRLMDEFTSQKISISTIGIGATMINTEFLGWLASRSGGQFYQMRNLDELPTLIVRDTQRSLGELPFAEGYFQPQTAPGATWFDAKHDWPPVKGYLTATTKPEATTELLIRAPRDHASGEGVPAREGATAAPQPGVAGPSAATDETEAHPLLAQWPLGAGRVAVFTSDAQARWCPEWLRWPQFANTWFDIVQRVMRGRPTDDWFVWVDRSGASPQLIVEGELAEPTASLMLPDGSLRPLSLAQEGRQRWQAALQDLDSGWYQVVVQSQLGGESGKSSALASLAKRWVHVGQVRADIEQPNLPPDEPALRRLAQATGGFYDLPDRAFVPPTEPVRVNRPLRPWWLLLAIVLLLIDAALRGRSML